MTVRVGEVRVLGTKDFGLVVDVQSDYVVVAPGTVDDKMVGQYVEKNGVKFSMYLKTPIEHFLLGPIVGHVPVNGKSLKIGQNPPKDFSALVDRWQTIRYISTPDDLRRFNGER